MNRPLHVGDVVVIRPEAVAALAHEGYDNVPARKPATITDTWTSVRGRRVLQLDMRLRTHVGSVAVTVWPSQVRLANGTVERYIVKREARVAEMVARKEAEKAETLARANARYARKVVARLVRMWMQADRRSKP